MQHIVVPIVKDWGNPHNENTMYGENQLKALHCVHYFWTPTRFRTFAKANELRKVRVAKEVNFYI